MGLLISILVILPNSVRVLDGILIFLCSHLVFGYSRTGQDYKQIVKSYKSREYFINSLTRFSADFIVYKDSKFSFVHCNQAFKNIADATNIDEIIGYSDYDILPKEAADVIREHDIQILKTRQPVQFVMECEIPSVGLKRIYNFGSHPVIENGHVIGIFTIARDITASEKLKIQCMEKQSHLEAIFNNIPIVTYLKDKDCNFVRGNKKFYELHGVPEEDVSSSDDIRETQIYKKYQKFKEDNQEMIAEDQMLMDKKLCVSKEEKLSLLNGSLNWYRVYKSPIINEAGEAIGIVTCVEDIHSEREVIDERETFVATLSHDLKTPTIAQIRSLELLKQKVFGELNDKQEEMINLVLNSCRYMLEMVSMILYTYKYQHGEIVLVPEKFSLTDLIIEICSEVGHFAMEKNIEINVNTNGSDCIIVADKLQMKRVITNLLTNSINYAQNDTKINISVEDFDSSIIEFMVKNKSAYIPTPILENLFDKYTTHSSKFSKVGMGLGLYIAKKIIESHMGEMIYESKKENENIFGFRVNKEFLIHDYTNFSNLDSTTSEK